MITAEPSTWPVAATMYTRITDMISAIFAGELYARWERLIGLSQPVCLFLLAKINSELWVGQRSTACP